MNTKIKILVTASIPDGKYCIRYNQVCQFLVAGEDVCGMDRCTLYKHFVDWTGKNNYEKCDKCKEKLKEAKGIYG